MSLYDPELEVGSKLERVLIQVGSERKRQVILREQGRFRNTPAEAPPLEAAAMLTEEVGECARAAMAVSGLVQEGLTWEDFRKELIQVAAVAVAIVEGIDCRLACHATGATEATDGYHRESRA